MNKKLASTILFFCLMFGISINLFAQNTDYLEDLFGDAHKYYNFTDITVLVEDLQENVKNVGLTTKQIQTDVEISLQKAGLRINKDAKQYLYINLNSIDVNSYTMAYSIQISLKQRAYLDRDKSLFSTATTWDRGLIGTIDKSNIRKIRDTISGLVDEFINKYLKYQSEIKNKKIPLSKEEEKKLLKEVDSILGIKPKKEDSPFTETYIGGNSPPEIEIINDSD